MSGRHEDPVEILDDDSEAAQEPEPEPGASAVITKSDEPVPEPEGGGDDDDPEEYTVEAIRARRKHPKTGVEEYFIKWEGFPEADNTWEPLENLKCPELIQKFKEDEKNKRRKKKADKLANQPAKRLRRDNSVQESIQGSEETMVEENLFLENDDDEDDDDDAELRQQKQRGRPKNSKDTASDQINHKGFKRGLPLERILSGSLGDDKKLYFFVKWQGRDALELVDADEVEEKASLELCKWYRDRLYWQSASPVEQ